MKITVSRRKFLSLGTSAILATSLAGRRAAAAPDVSGYRALVCVFLYGGNNGFNWLVPTSDAAYNVYKTSRSNLALPQASLLALNGTASDGNTYGMHASCPELQALYNGGEAALLCNVGTLVQPTTTVQARSGTVALPPQLFSHEDQQNEWMSSIPQSLDRYGWAGRIADYYAENGLAAQLSFNVNVGGANYWQDGKRSVPYVLGTGGAPTIDVVNNAGYRNGTRQQAAYDLLTQGETDANLLVRQFVSIERNADAKVDLVNNAFAAAGNLATPFPNYDGDDSLGAQLKQVARCIKAHSQVGDSRQLFFVRFAGFDTHNDELGRQAGLLSILSKNLKSFRDAMLEIGMQNSVTLFTNSDFGRTLSSNGDGSDHAWGNHHLILGGAVQGAKYYGQMPSLALGGADDFGAGRIVPTSSTDQYAATLASWFGIPDAGLDAIFPNLTRFGARNLGFLS